MLRSLHVQTLVLANSGLGIAHVKERRIRWANPRWAEIFGVLPEHLAGASMAPFHLDAAAFEAFGHLGYDAIEREGRFSGEVRFRRVDGSLFWGFLVGSLLVPGRPEEGAIWCLEDISARCEAQQERDDALKLNAAADRRLPHRHPALPGRRRGLHAGQRGRRAGRGRQARRPAPAELPPHPQLGGAGAAGPGRGGPGHRRRAGPGGRVDHQLRPGRGPWPAPSCRSRAGRSGSSCSW